MLNRNAPYSQRELQCNRNKVFRTMRIGVTRAHHKRCDHFYFVKERGRKEKEIKEANSEDVGNCSVCWKFNKTPRHLKTKARGLIDLFGTRLLKPPPYLTYDDVDLETIFYTWLYEEFN